MSKLYEMYLHKELVLDEVDKVMKPKVVKGIDVCPFYSDLYFRLQKRSCFSYLF